MTIRITGMNSGLDVDAIIKEMVKAQQTKTDTYKKDQTSLEWKQDAWKELNTKIYALFNGAVNKMRFSDAYSKKTTKVSNSNAVSVITGKDAMLGVQELTIDKLAKAGYMTGAKLDSSTTLTSKSKLSELGIDYGSKLQVTVDGQVHDVAINGDMTIDQLVTGLRSAGISANFDEHNQRFYLGSTKSGAAGDFEITSSDPNVLFKLGMNKGMTAAQMDAYVASVDYTQADIDGEVARRTDAINAAIATLNGNKTEPQTALQKLIDDNGYDGSTSQSIQARINAIKEDDTLTDEEKQNKIEEEDLNNKLDTAKKAETFQKQLDDIDDQIAEQQAYLDNGGQKLIDEVSAYYGARKDYAGQLKAKYDADPSSIAAANKVDGRDAEITLNGTTYTSGTNVFEVNGLTFTALDETPGQKITVTTQEDTDGIYDMVRDFIKEYSSLMNEMDKLYNTKVDKKYQPLTDEERDAMSDTTADKWEQKVKDAVLYKDESISSVSNALKMIMLEGVEVNGKTMHLSDFGINTLGYFTSADNEKNAYHIDGDPDDPNTASKDDVLKGMIASDPDTVMNFFTGLTKNLYKSMSEMSSSIDGYRTFNSFYNDIKMKNDYEDYSDKIKEQEKRLKELENKYYQQFSAMETALAKLQSSQSAISSILGGGQ